MDGASGLPSFASAFLFFEAAAMPLAWRFISLVVDWKDGDTEAARSRRSRIRIRTSSPFRVQQPAMVLRFVSRPPRLARDPGSSGCDESSSS